MEDALAGDKESRKLRVCRMGRHAGELVFDQ